MLTRMTRMARMLTHMLTRMARILYTLIKIYCSTKTRSDLYGNSWVKN